MIGAVKDHQVSKEVVNNGDPKELDSLKRYFHH